MAPPVHDPSVRPSVGAGAKMQPGVAPRDGQGLPVRLSPFPSGNPVDGMQA